MIDNLNEQIAKIINDSENPCQKMIMDKLEEIIHYPLPKDVLFVVKNFIDVISVIQGELDALTEMCIKQQIEIKLLQKKLKTDQIK